MGKFFGARCNLFPVVDHKWSVPYIEPVTASAVTNVLPRLVFKMSNKNIVM